jgi:AcrR family transcriptional regulator
LLDGDELPERRGRKRDARLDRLILRASFDLYAKRGWSGFSFEAVAREASIGKPAIYLRWESREQLLGAALQLLSWPEGRDLGSLREDLRDWIPRMMGWWASNSGAAYLRWQADSRFNSDLAKHYDDVVQWRVESVRAMIARGVERGEIGSDVDQNLLLEQIAGAAQTRALINARRPSATRKKSNARFADRLIEVILAQTSA